MKVVLLANADSVHTVRWANGLSKRGLDVVVATQDAVSADIIPSVRTVSLPYRGEVGYFRNARPFRRLLAIERPHLVNAHYASGYGTTARLSRFRPTLLSVWGSDVYQFPFRSIIHRWLLRSNLAAATHIASTSQAMATHTSSLVPGLAPIAITPFGVDMDLFRPQLREAVRREIVVGTVKALRPVYGIDLLIRSFAMAREQLRGDDADLAVRLCLRIVGDGPEGGELTALVNSLGLSDVVEFTPHVPHDAVPDVLAQLDIYVALSRMESFGVAIIEASACGLPVVVSDAGGLPEVVAHGRTGFVVQSGNVEAAARAIVDLVLDAELRRDMGKAGRERVSELYDWHANVDLMIRLYEDLV